jgi:tetratricopeptide (TPR) repeat protein
MSSDRGLCRIAIVVVVLGVLTIGVRARAQSNTDATPPSATPEAAAAEQTAPPVSPEPPAAVPPPQPAPIDTAIAREARELTARARERFDAGDYAAALLEFTRAHELLADDPRAATLLNNIAVCHERLFRYDLALVYYERYLREGNVTADDRAEVEAVIRGLRDLLGKLHLTSNVRAEVWVDGRLLGHAPGDIQVPSGPRVVELRADGHQASRRSLQVAARSVTSVHFELEPLATSYRGIDRRYFWSGVGLTGVALVTGSALGLTALNQYNDAKELKRQHLLKPGQYGSTTGLALGADIAFGAAAVFGVSTLVLGFMTDFGEKKPDRARQLARFLPQPRIGAGSVGLGFAGAFQ